MPRQLQDGFGCVKPITVVTPIARGGTAANNAPTAVTNLGGISRDKIDIPLGVAGADEDGYLKMKYLDALGIFTGLTLEGPTELVKSDQSFTSRPVFFVSNYDVDLVPSVHCDDAAVAASMVFDWPYFSFNVPSTGTELSITINGREYLFPLIDNGIEKPQILLSSNNTIPNAGLIFSSKFRTIAGTNIGDVSSWAPLPEGELTINMDVMNRDIYVKGRAGETGLIEIFGEDDVHIFPKSQYWVRYSPLRNGRYGLLNRGGAEGAYVVIDNLMPHTATDWEIALDAAFTNVVYSEHATTTNLLSLPVILPTENYFMRVRYHSGMQMSVWSDAVSFTVAEDTSGLTEKSITIDPVPAADARFGTSAAVGQSGLIAIGAPVDTKSANRSGAVYLYQQHGYLTQYLGSINSVNGLSGESFGASVSVRSDDRIFIGAPGLAAGVVYYYDGSEGAFSRSGVISPRPSSVHFGTSVKVINNHLFIGDPYDNTNGVGTGAVHVYDLDGNDYRFRETIFPQTPVGEGHFGCSIESDSAGDLLFIGATSPNPDDTENGLFYVFRKVNGAYTESEIRNSPMPVAGDGFGRGLAYDQHHQTLYVGCEHDGQVGEGAGAVFVFSLTVAGSVQLTHTTTLYPDNPDDHANFGTSLAVSRDGYCLYVGAPGYQLGTEAVGAVYCLT